MMWFISDFHFGHTHVIQYENRPFKNLDEMHEILIKNFHDTVPKNSTVFILGDLWKASYLSSFQNYRLHLILGNHDRSPRKMRDIYDVIYENNLNMIVYYKPIIVQNFLILSHEPYEGLTKKDHFLNIHGHTHSRFYKTGTWSEGNRYFNACVENINYRPINLSEIFEKMCII